MKKRCIKNRLKYLFSNYKKIKGFNVDYYFKFVNGDESLVKTKDISMENSNMIFDDNLIFQFINAKKEIKELFKGEFLEECKNILKEYKNKRYFYLDNSCYKKGKDIVSCRFHINNLKEKKISYEEFLREVLE